jgi:hypothetical protein
MDAGESGVEGDEQKVSSLIFLNIARYGTPWGSRTCTKYSETQIFRQGPSQFVAQTRTRDGTNLLFPLLSSSVAWPWNPRCTASQDCKVMKGMSPSISFTHIKHIIELNPIPHHCGPQDATTCVGGRPLAPSPPIYESEFAQDHRCCLSFTNLEPNY